MASHSQEDAATAEGSSGRGSGGRGPGGEGAGGGAPAAEEPAASESSADELSDGERRILSAAQALIAEEGLDALSMRAVAGRVGVSATAIYHYFEGKDDLLNWVVGRAFRHFKTYLREASEPHPPGSWDRIQALGDAYLRFAEENEEYFRVLFTIHPEHRSEIEELPGKGGYELMKEAVSAAMEEGEVRDDDVEEIVVYLWAVAHGLLTLSLACKLRIPPTEEGELLRATELYRRVKDYLPGGLRPREEDGG